MRFGDERHCCLSDIVGSEIVEGDMTKETTRRRVLQGFAGLGTALLTPVRAAGLEPLRMGYQKGAGLLGLLKAQATLEKMLAPRGWDVTWSEYAAGPQLLEALNAGAVDFGYTGAPPPIFAQAAAVELLYVGAEPVGPSSEAIVVKRQAPLLGVLDLKGRSVAVQKGSSAHYLLLASLDKAGLGLRDLQIDFLPPAYGRAAFDSNRVDAWAIWDPHLAGVQAAYPLRVLADYGNLSPVFGFYIATRRFAGQRPDGLALLLEELATAGAWITRHPKEAAGLLAPQVGLTAEVAEVWQRRTCYGVIPVDVAVIAAQQRIADLFLRNALIPNKVDVAAAVWRWHRS
jgi:sulfonate transport system substrate-binding protein